MKPAHAHSSPPAALAASAGLFLLVLAGCGGATPETTAESSTGAAPAAGQSTAAIDPCALITSAEAAKALGAAVGAAERPKEANFPPTLVTCRYTAPRGQALAVMSVMVRQGYSDAEARTGFQSAQEQFAGAETIAGLGDAAFWFGNQINVLRGRSYLNITGDFDQATARSLAQTALTRLP